MTTLLVRHIGLHAKRADTMSGEGTVWYGPGDIKPVSPRAWEILKRYPDLWELVEEDEKPTSAGATLADADAAVDLAAMDRDALYALAVERGLKPHHKHGADKLRELLA